MIVEVRMPQLGITMDEAEIVRWMVSTGDAVEKGQPLLEIQTDKAVVEVESPAGGVITSQSAAPGQVVPVAGLLALIATPGGDPRPS